MYPGMSGTNAGKATDAAMKRVALKRVALIFIDNQAAAHRMLADTIDQARAERRRRAIGQGVDLQPLTEADLDLMLAQQALRADLPGSVPKRRKQRATARETAQTAGAEAVRMRR